MRGWLGFSARAAEQARGRPGEAGGRRALRRLRVRVRVRPPLCSSAAQHGVLALPV